jgi:ATP-dependent DNA helicase RecG
MLLMTATPIPRTLAIMQYGGMSLSTINQLPPGRTPVETHVVQDNDLGRQQVRPGEGTE